MLNNFSSLKKEIKIKKFETGKFIEGEWIDRRKIRKSERMVAVSITPKMLRNLPEGDYTTEDMKFYQDGKPRYDANDIFIVEDAEYKIKDIADRSKEANVTIYYGKRIRV